LSDSAIEVFASLLDSLPTRLSFLTGWAISGAASRVAADATAVGEREVGYEIRLIAVWPPEDPAAGQHAAWVHEGWNRLRAHGNGRQYPTFLSDERLSGVRAAYQDGWARLVALKDRYDPGNMFRLNANIPPSSQSAEPTHHLVSSCTSPHTATNGVGSG
jgi:FAD/FMN-containing dehydrogenase